MHENVAKQAKMKPRLLLFVFCTGLIFNQTGQWTIGNVFIGQTEVE